jgi:SNF2 family DNA or RNA helicase
MPPLQSARHSRKRDEVVDGKHQVREVEWKADLKVPVEIYATGWGTALSRPINVAVTSLALDEVGPQTISLQIRPAIPKIASLVFPNSSDSIADSAPARVKNTRRTPTPSSQTITRIRPPGDAIKLRDRLYYLLQPPLETILASSTCPLPFDPFPYQYEGIAFLFSRFAAILADEMGLGKTMQAITAIRLLLRAGELGSVLLICPKPLVTNWQREFETWAGEIPLCTIAGDRERRRWQWLEADSPVKIANYELLMRDKEVLIDSGNHFDLVVLDEAQRIKNRSSTTSLITCAIPRSRSWALTGTPVENSTDDLVGIFDFLAPGYLYSGMKVRQMAKAAGDYILRRTKDMVMTDLPPKLFRDAEIELTPTQWDSYRTAEEDGIVRLEHMGQELTIQHVFELVLRLKQICNFDPSTGDSSKLERLEADLEEVAASGKKAIVFSQWVATLNRIRDHLARFRPLEYHGQVPMRKREQVIDKFRSDASSHLILMSYGAGSVGLNLQFCEYVFLFDRWWNPAVEDQAINRAHRIGAAGPVTVTRMLTLGTIEERINQVLAEKRELFEMVLGQTESPRSLGMTQSEIFGLFDLTTPTSRAA